MIGELVRALLLLVALFVLLPVLAYVVSKSVAAGVMRARADAAREEAERVKQTKETKSE